ncbi:hypothetical protein Rfer_4382 (plasmid) [Rhodoferax ferrireducens T118]|uniref:Uncharacterized protein n=1 Tax=Albidiferax ferrireducens (strain ATCC BAA-621 / DSM 15236 / T118) TaxID=338969 RepID=Q21Q77_ALBFT|nr:hypothetical protein Rfer_4382 [Rhodoferax ferrireducens T118]
MSRCITDVVPALADLPWDTATAIEVEPPVAAEIRADCAFYIDPKAVDATAGERAAYRALLHQIDAATCCEVTPEGARPCRKA